MYTICSICYFIRVIIIRFYFCSTFHCFYSFDKTIAEQQRCKWLVPRQFISVSFSIFFLVLSRFLKVSGTFFVSLEVHKKLKVINNEVNFLMKVVFWYVSQLLFVFKHLFVWKCIVMASRQLKTATMDCHPQCLCLEFPFNFNTDGLVWTISFDSSKTSIAFPTAIHKIH